MKVSTKARYAVMAMVDLAVHGQDNPVSLSEIANRQDLPLPYLEQLFNKLKKAELVKSSRGSNGGYILNHPPAQTRVIDIIYAVDTPVKITRCEVHSAKGCHKTGIRCLTHDLWEELEEVIRTFLSRTSLADICNRQTLGLMKFNLHNKMLENDSNLF